MPSSLRPIFSILPSGNLISIRSGLTSAPWKSNGSSVTLAFLVTLASLEVSARRRTALMRATSSLKLKGLTM